MTNVSFSPVEGFPLSMVFMREVRENKETLLRPEFAYVDLMARWRIYLGGERYAKVTRFTCILSQLPPCKIRKTIGMLSKLRHFVPCSVLVNIYNALITPHLTFGPVSWGKAWKTYLDKILILQKCALRLIYSANRQDHAIPLFVKVKVLPLNFLYHESVLNLMHNLT